ncbi:YbhB/YbcL family Raf kinase inhibitor-like protein [Halorhodospira neutriphila]|uniref:Phospholipid-binding protein n=1 Tax=Halorhodospira neutriphila TaxID=168379 RepID=A0ABS1E612_9GAMM|nr:phospholipid-binding protein [Halorhodospira neutriphila]
MRLISESLEEGGALPERCAFCARDAQAHARYGRNRSPHLGWEGLPPGTRSLALVCHDPDAPSQLGDANRGDREIPADLPRLDFFHWLLVDLDPALGAIPEGAFADGVVAGGKPGPEAPYGARQGVNSYTELFAGSAEMAGTYFGYDGPCPPWNDSIPHRCVFTLYALDCPRAPVAGAFGGEALLAALRGRLLGQAAITVAYSLNPRVPAG